MCIEAVAMMTRGSFCSGSTMDLCIALWHRVGGRQFRHWEVKDLVPNGSQLRSMQNRGYLKVVGTERSRYRWQTITVKVWQLTDQVRELAEVVDGS